MKVVSAKQMGVIESNAYRDGASESEFMEEAGSGISLAVFDFAEFNNTDRHATLLCGKGNNGGDAYVTGINLLFMHFDVVAIQIAPIEECSKLCQQNYHRFLGEGGRVIQFNTIETLDFPDHGVLIDGIFGTGFQDVPREPYATMIRMANDSRLPIISIDIPSGLSGNNGVVKGDAIIATQTIYLGLPKTGFFLRQGWAHVGKIHHVDYGLPSLYIQQSNADFFLLTPENMKPLLPRIANDRHKYQAGLVVGLAGSPGMPGAAMLSCSAALNGGAGVVRLLHPQGMEQELSSSPYELIKVPYTPQYLTPIIELLNKGSSVFVGPGLGTQDEIKTMLKKILPLITVPCVIDADALTILAEEMVPLPEQTILTPHHGEMAKLLKINSPQAITETFLNKCQEYAITNKVTLVLKGGSTFIFQKEEPVRVNGTGDPGMATAGSGDVLTGLIASFLAQGLKPHDAACLGVYIHGLAGAHAAQVDTSYCMTASDIINYFPEAFRFELL